MIQSSHVAATDFESKIMNRIESNESKLQLLIDVNIPPALNDTTFDEIHGRDEQKSGDKDEVQIVADPIQCTGWNELLHCVSEVAADVRAVKEAATVNKPPPVQLQQQPDDKEDDTIGRSVVIYGLQESSATSNTLMFEHLIKQLDSSLPIDSKKSLTPGTKPPPLLVVLSSEFDRHKLLCCCVLHC